MTSSGIDRPDAALSARDALSHALRLGLATHPRFPSATHQRLLLDCLYEIPTQRLDVKDLVAAVERRFDGVRLTWGQVRNALEQLVRDGVIEVEHADRTGTKRYWLTESGVRDWEQARSAGFALEDRVRNQFFDEFGLASDNATRAEAWRSLLDALEQLFRKEAFQVAQAFLDNGDLAEIEPGIKQRTGAWPDTPTFTMLGTFMRTATGDRMVFLRKLMNGSLAYHLFRASPTADAAVRNQIKGRTYYLDTTVLYSLAAREGDLSVLRDDLVRITKELGCRLKVTNQTLREFQESVRHYKSILEQRGITDVAMARALLSPQAIDDLDDFRRGFYQELLHDSKLTIDIYALRYETIEEQLPKWGIGAIEDVQARPVRDERGEWIELPQVDEYTASITDYLKKYPRRGRESDEPDPVAVRHDATMVAWVQYQRGFRGIAVPTRPSQVQTWFLTRDRRLTNWDRDYVVAHGLGNVPRCLTLDDWLEAVAVLVPSLADDDGVNALALRELALTCPPIPQDDELSADDLQQVGRAAEVFELHPYEAARIVADKQFSAELKRASSVEARFQAIKAGVIRLKDFEIESLRQAALTHRSAAEKAANDAKRERLERQRADVAKKTLEDARNALIGDAEFGRGQRWRGPASITVAVALAGTALLLVAFNPSFWASSNLLQRLFAIGAFTCIDISAALWAGGYSKRARDILAGLGTILALVLAVLESWAKLGVLRL